MTGNSEVWSLEQGWKSRRSLRWLLLVLVQEEEEEEGWKGRKLSMKSSSPPPPIHPGRWGGGVYKRPLPSCFVQALLPPVNGVMDVALFFSGDEKPRRGLRREEVKGMISSKSRWEEGGSQGERTPLYLAGCSVKRAKVERKWEETLTWQDGQMRRPPGKYFTNKSSHSLKSCEERECFEYLVKYLFLLKKKKKNKIKHVKMKKSNRIHLYSSHWKNQSIKSFRKVSCKICEFLPPQV